MKRLALWSMLLFVVLNVLAGCASHDISAEDQAKKSDQLDKIAKSNPGSVGMDK